MATLIVVTNVTLTISLGHIKDVVTANTTRVGGTTTTTIATTIGHSSTMKTDGLEKFENTYFTLRTTFSIIRLCLAIFGVLANSVTCFVLTNKKLWSPTSLLLMTLVAYDALFLLASIPLCVVDTFLNLDLETFAIICGIFYPIRYMAQTGSIYTTVSLTIERYIIVLRPFKARAFCTFGKIKRFILVIFFFSIVFNIPRCFFYNLATSFSQDWAVNMTSLSNNSGSLVPESSEVTPTGASASVRGEQADSTSNSNFDNSQSESAERYAFYVWLYSRVYELYVSGVLFYLLPYALIPILNFQLLLVIKQRRHETRQISLKKEHQHKNTKATDKEDGLTMIVLGITVCFFICCLIPAVYNVTQIANVPPTTPFSIYLLIASDTMLCVNASTDFFFYCLLGGKFRSTFLYIFCRRSECVKGRYPTMYGQSRHSDTFYHTV